MKERKRQRERQGKRKRKRAGRQRDTEGERESESREREREREKRKLKKKHRRARQVERMQSEVRREIKSKNFRQETEQARGREKIHGQRKIWREGSAADRFHCDEIPNECFLILIQGRCHGVLLFYCSIWPHLIKLTISLNKLIILPNLCSWRDSCLGPDNSSKTKLDEF